MIALLVLFTVGLMAGPAISRPPCHDVQPNLDRMFEIAKNFTLHKKSEVFVEDVYNLTHGQNRCQDTFFCKVYNILDNPKKFGKTNDEKELVRNLNICNVCRNVNCLEVLKDVPHSHIEITLHKLMDHLLDCIQQKNLQRITTSSSLMSPNV